MAYNLTLTNATFVASSFGQALSSGTGVTTPITAITSSMASWGISLRIKKTAPSSLTIAIGQTKMFYIGIDGNGNVQCNYGSSSEQSVLTSGTRYDDGVSHLVAVDFDANGMRLYVDGVQKATKATTWASSGPGTPGNISIGNYNGGYAWTGEIDDVAIFSTAQHTGASYTPPTTATSTQAPNLLALWALDGNGNDTAGVAPPAATALTLTGPTSGVVNTASSNFTVALSPTGGTVASAVTVTPSDGGASGTFSPATVSLTTASPSATFTYTAVSTGPKTISVANNGSLTNPSAITYTVTATADTTAPTMNGTLTVSSITSTSATLTWVAGSDDVGVTSYEVDPGTGTYTNVGNVLTYNITGLSASTAYTANVRADDAAGNKSTPLSAQFTTAAPPLVNYIDTTKIKFSPGNWVTTSTTAKGINSGIYFETVFTGNNVTLTWDMTNISNVQVMWRIDKYGPWTIQDMAASMPLTMPTDTSAWATKPGHFLEVFIKARTENTLRWSYPMTLNGIYLDNGATLTIPPTAPLKGMVFGDSITEGCRTVKPLGTPDQYSHDSFLGWANEYRHLLGAEIGIVGFSAQGWGIMGAGSVPSFNGAYNYVYQGVPRTFPTDLDFIEIAHGTNDGSGLTSATVLTGLNGVLAATTSRTKIILTSPFSGSGATAIQAAISQCSDPTRCYYISGIGLFTTANSSDGTHPYGSENIVHIAPAKASLVKTILAASTAITPVARTVTLTLGDASGPAANLTNVSVAVYEQSTPGSSVAPVYKTENAATNASGVMSLTVQTTLASGATGRVEVRTQDGRHYNGPVSLV
jgi:hypothetical protein